MNPKGGKKFSSDYQPGERKTRGASQRTLILDAIKEASMLDLNPKSTRVEAEKAFIRHTAIRAFDVADPNSATLLKTLWDKGWGSIKSTAPSVEIKLDTEASALDQVKIVLEAMANGEVAPDVAAIVIGSIKDVISIAEHTELADRIKQIEDKLK